MQPVYLASLGKFELTKYISYEFDGSQLRVYLNNILVHKKEAVPGEVYYITPCGLNKPPLIAKVALPTEKGQKIAWALSFTANGTRTKSKSEFLQKLYEFEETNQNRDKILTIEKGKYAFAFLQIPEKKDPKPILSYISDKITYVELEKLIKDFSECRKIYCPEVFLYSI